MTGEPCPLCCDTRLDPRFGLAPRATMIYLEERLPASVFIAIAEAMRAGEQVRLEIDPPPDSGVPTVELTRRRKHAVRKRA